MTEVLEPDEKKEVSVLRVPEASAKAKIKTKTPSASASGTLTWAGTLMVIESELQSRTRCWHWLYQQTSKGMFQLE